MSGQRTTEESPQVEKTQKGQEDGLHNLYEDGAGLDVGADICTTPPSRRDRQDASPKKSLCLPELF
jgi:hypothetical protein